MKPFETLQQVLEFAIQEEQEAAAFYRALAAATEDARLKEILESFAREEQEHERKLNHVQIDGPQQLSDSLRKKLVEDPGAPEAPELGMDYPRLLELVIAKEMAAVRMYAAMAEDSDDAEMQALLNGLAEEEARHREAFEKELAAL